MKKTIAILLILVIGMVGVFADPVVNKTPKVINLSTEVEQVHLLLLTSSEYTEYADYGDAQEDLADIDLTVGAKGVLTGGASQDEIWITIFSNDRSGYKVTYTAAALESDDHDIIDFDVEIIGVNDTAIGTRTTNDNTATIVDYSSGIAGTSVFSGQIKITIDANFDTAVAGDYAGSITFEFAAQ